MFLWSCSGSSEEGIKGCTDVPICVIITLAMYRKRQLFGERGYLKMLCYQVDTTVLEYLIVYKTFQEDWGLLCSPCHFMVKRISLWPICYVNNINKAPTESMLSGGTYSVGLAL